MVSTQIMRLKNSQYIITIPKTLAELKNWVKGDRLRWLVDSLGQVIIQKER